MFGLKSTLITALVATMAIAAPTSSTPASEIAVSGKMTFWNPALGACGKNHGDGDIVVAIGKNYWTAGNPNLDPLCSKSVTITYGGKSATASIVDKCEICGPSNIDVSPAVFRMFGAESQGVISPVNWRIN